MVVVNFSTKHYLAGQRRLKESVHPYQCLTFDSYDQIGSPTQQESPYQFKIHAIEKALEKDDIVLWADSSMYRRGDLSKIENLIKEDGYYQEEAGHYVGRWTNDFTKDYFKLTEEEAKQETGGLIMFSAGLQGLNKNSEVAMEYFRQWKESALAGCFRGDYANHRHDMSCASIISQRLGMKLQKGGTYMAYVGPGYSEPSKDVVFLCQGML